MSQKIYAKVRDRLGGCFLLLAMVCSFFLFPGKPCSAAAVDVVGELGSMAVDAAAGALQDDDKAIAADLKQQIDADASHKQELAQYLEATRPEIEARQQSVKKYMTGMVWAQQHLPIMGGWISDGISAFYVWRYESALEDKANSDFLKRFVKLREHSIDANQSIMEIATEMVAENNKGDLSNDESLAKVTHIKQLVSRYGSAAAAMNEVYQAAGIEAQPIDDGNIFNLIEHPAQEKVSDKADEDTSDRLADVGQKMSDQKTSTQSNANLTSYKQAKTNYDQQIVQFANAVNAHLQSTDNFRQTNFAGEGRALNNRILQTKAQLQQDGSISDADKGTLLQLFDLESQRIMGMVSGIESSLHGGDYHPGFSRGTAASYQFDDVNKQLQ